MGVLARRWSSDAIEPVLDQPLVRPGTDLGRAIRLAVIHNPKSGGNRRRGRLHEIREQIAVARIPHREGDTLEGLVDGTQSLLRDGAEVIAVNGGDGTVQAVLTGLLRAEVEGPLPLVAVLPGGTTNTTARNVGYGVGTSAAIAELALSRARRTPRGRRAEELRRPRGPGQRSRSALRDVLRRRRRLPRHPAREGAGRVARHARSTRRRSHARPIPHQDRDRRGRNALPAALRAHRDRRRSRPRGARSSVSSSRRWSGSSSA